MNAKELATAINESAFLISGNLRILVVIIGARSACGRTDYLIRPVGGVGERWVSQESVLLPVTAQGSMSACPAPIVMQRLLALVRRHYPLTVSVSWSGANLGYDTFCQAYTSSGMELVFFRQVMSDAEGKALGVDLLHDKFCQLVPCYVSGGVQP